MLMVFDPPPVSANASPGRLAVPKGGRHTSFENITLQLKIKLKLTLPIPEYI